MKVLSQRQTELAENLLAEKSFGGKKQANHSNAYNKLNQNDSFEAAMEQLEKVRGDFERTVMASLKHQNIIGMLSGDGSGGSNDSQQRGIMDLSKMTVDIAQGKTLINQMQRLVESNEQSQIELYMGKEVYYDDTIRNYSGNDITFNYELKYGNFPQGTNISARISIFDEKGRMVYNGKCNNNNGSNKFLWNGRDDKGQEVAEGKYRMEVSASATLAGSKATLPINVTSSLSGVVDGIRVSDGKRLLVVNDKLVDPDNITEYKNVKADNEAIPVSASADLIGKQATIDLSAVRVMEGKGELIYDNQVQIEHPGDVRVDIADKNGKPLTTIIYNEPLLAGVGTLELDAKKHKLDDGDYNYTLYVQDTDNQQNIQLSKVKLVNVTGVDIKDKKIIAGSATYPLTNITGIIGESKEERFLTGLAASYIGKQVEYENSNFNHNSGDQFTRDVRIQRPAPGQHLGDAVLKIYKGEQLVASVQKPEADLYHQDAVAVPTFDQLNAWSRKRVNSYIRTTLRLPHVTTYNDLERPEKLAINRYIEEQFKSGVFFENTQDHTDEAIKLRNMGIVKFSWDGRKIDGLLAENGEYRYEVHTTTVDNITNINTPTKVSTITNDLVKSSIVENGQLHFELASGRTITDKQILAIKT